MRKTGWFFMMAMWAVVMIISMFGMFMSTDPLMRLEHKVAFWGAVIMVNMTVMHKPDGLD